MTRQMSRLTIGQTAKLTFVSCVNRPEVAQRCLLASPCLQPEQGHQLILASGMTSAGQGAQWGARLARHHWMVLLHQDVYLPEGWDTRFLVSLAAAEQAFPGVALAGVYGVRADSTHFGHVFDRDRWLGEECLLPEKVRSLDELLLAVRLDAGLLPDPGLGWHLYGTDVCLQAEAKGLPAVVLDAPCEHRASLLREPDGRNAVHVAAMQPVVDAFNASVRRLTAVWPQAMPVTTTVATVCDGFQYALPLAHVSEA